MPVAPRQSRHYDIERALELQSGLWIALRVKAIVLDRQRRYDEARAITSDLLARARATYVQPSVLAYAAFLVSGIDEAFVYLERACQDNDLLPVLNYYPSAIWKKHDPRWPALMRRIGIEPGPVLE